MLKLLSRSVQRIIERAERNRTDSAGSLLEHCIVAINNSVLQIQMYPVDITKEISKSRRPELRNGRSYGTISIMRPPRLDKFIPTKEIRQPCN